MYRRCDIVIKRTRTKSGVYFIKNLVNGKVYTGSSFDVFNRLKYHKKTLEKGKHLNIKLQRAWNKYGASNFQSIFFEKVIDLESIAPREQYWMDYMDSYKNGYNMCPTAGSCLGIKHSPEARKNMSDGHKGQKSWNKGMKGVYGTKKKGAHLSDAMKEKLSIAHIGQIAWNKGMRGGKGKPCSDALKEKISKGNKGKRKGHIMPLHVKEALRKANTGRPGYWAGKKHSDLTKKKIGDNSKGHIVTPETRIKIGLANSIALKGNIPWNKGKTNLPKRSLETIRKMQESQKLRWSIRKGVA